MNPHIASEARQRFDVRILGETIPRSASYWQGFRLKREQGLNVTGGCNESRHIRRTEATNRSAPIAYEANCLEEVCGSCTMLINGRVRQACSALVDRLLEESPGQIELRPMSKFPVIRDLVVDRRRLSGIGET